jgi:hypothetical protein
LTRLSPPTSRTISILIKPGPARLGQESRRPRGRERGARARAPARGPGGRAAAAGRAAGAHRHAHAHAHTRTHHSGDAHPRAHTQRQLAFLPGFLPVCSAPDRPLVAARGRPHRTEAGESRRLGQRGPRVAAAAHARPVPARGGHRDSAGPPAAGDVKMSVGCACPGKWGARPPSPSLLCPPCGPLTPCLARTYVGGVEGVCGGVGAVRGKQGLCRGRVVSIV